MKHGSVEQPSRKENNTNCGCPDQTKTDLIHSLWFVSRLKHGDNPKKNNRKIQGKLIVVLYESQYFDI